MSVSKQRLKHLTAELVPVQQVQLVPPRANAHTNTRALNCHQLKLKIRNKKSFSETEKRFVTAESAANARHVTARSITA